MKNSTKKYLTIIRHGKSSWIHDVNDMERPLKNRGITDALLVSETFKQLKLIPEIIYSSPAKRAYSTAEIFFKNIEISDKKIHVNSQLYDFQGDNLVNFITSIPNKYTHAMLFGHNNALTNFINTYGDNNLFNLPTSGLAVFEFNIDSWEDLKPGKIVQLLLPKNLQT